MCNITRIGKDLLECICPCIEKDAVSSWCDIFCIRLNNLKTQTRQSSAYLLWQKFQDSEVQLYVFVFCSNLPWFLFWPRFLCCNLTELVETKAVRTEPLLNTEWTRIESLSAVPVSCQWNFPILVFQTKRWNRSFKIWWIWTKGKWSNMQRYWRANARERALFGWIRPHPQPLKAAWFISNLFAKTNFWNFCHFLPKYFGGESVSEDVN